ncbi:charged multivesicular body protein 1b-like isoform X3 [Castor canadensis]|uniref:Charged multivesicular body protein 1b-like isoform X3 n=6 Tax=Castor canadensis TaxID=51338 RepID=A0AC58LTL8_CASCN
MPRNVIKKKRLKRPTLRRHTQVRRSSVWERASLSPMLSNHCHLWLRSWGRHLGTSGCSHTARVTLINFLPVCLATQAIQKGSTEVARIHAENAIRQKNQAINFLRMSTKIDAVAARVQTAVTMGKVTKSMTDVVKSMDATLKSLNLQKISALMDKFEQQFETLDVQTQQMEDTMSSTTALTTPQSQVDMLLQEMADEAGLDLNMELPQGQTGSVGTSVASMEQDELSQSLTCLRDQV